VLTSPLLILSALAIKLDSPGPVFFTQERVGKDGNDFRIIKFRTMVVGAEKQGAGYEVLAGDARITRLGNVLRRLHIDELPQLFNVLVGQMSLVGPRPTLRYQVEQYTAFQRRRLEMKPGMTGLAQVSGGNLLSWPRRIEMDVEYIDHWSWAMDFSILLRTVGVLVHRRGVYAQSTDAFKLSETESKNEEPRRS